MIDYVLDTSALTVAAAVEEAVRLVAARMAGG